MKKISGCILVAMTIFQVCHAQTRYIITFKNKDTNPFSFSAPGGFLSQRAIERRNRYSIALDSTDLPVTPRYIDSIRNAGTVTILNASKWLNSVSIQTTDAAAIAKINNYPFVKTVVSIAPRSSAPVSNKFDATAEPQPFPVTRMQGINDFFNYGTSFNQVHIHNGEFLHNIGLRGETMQIGMLDAGFNNYLTVKSFDSARTNGQILGTWDFVSRHASVNEDHYHGTECFSTIAANIPGQFVGTAPKANYYLFRSEEFNTEYPIEEHNWVCAAERLDSTGADVISSSLGYNTFDPPFTSFDHTYADMDGNTTITAIGADLAAKKGMLVVNSAGNEGSGGWHYIISPADGDSVLAVGAVNSSGTVAPFSSFGPSFDGRVKPDVASVGLGTVVQYPNNTIGTDNGTSFSAPNMAGLATCLWQGFREFNNMKIIDALRKSGNKSNAPDNRIGYGIPDMKKAVMQLIKEFAVTGAGISGCKINISWTSKEVKGMKYEVERQLPGETAFSKIHEQDGFGSVFGTHSNGYEDYLSNVQSGTISYRIRQTIDTSASGFMADYLDTVSVNLPVACLPLADSIVLFPNPVTDRDFTIRITTATPIPDLGIHIYNSKAQLIKVLKRNILPGATSIHIPAAFLAAGKYYITFYNGNARMETKELLIFRK